MVSCIKHTNTDGSVTKQVTLCNTTTDLSITTKDIAVIMDEMVVEQ